MNKKVFCVVTLFAFLFVGSAFGIAEWNGASGDNLWKTDGAGGNWYGGAAPSLTDDAVFYWKAAPGADVIIDNGTAATCNDLTGLGWNAGQHGSLTVQAGGSLEVAGILGLGQLGPSSLYVDGGTVTDGSGANELRIGTDQAGSAGVNEGYGGYLSITNGGSVTANTIYMPLGGTGHIQLDDGLLTSTNWIVFGAGGTMDIGADGKVVIPWADLTWMSTTYQPLIDSGQITGTGALNVYVGYEDGVGATLSTVPEPTTIVMLSLGGLGLIRRKRS